MHKETRNTYYVKHALRERYVFIFEADFRKSLSKFDQKRKRFYQIDSKQDLDS